MSFKGTSDLKAKTGANVAEHTWVPSEMIQKPIQPGFPTPTRPAPGNAISTKATTLPIQDFLSFHAATSRGNIDEEERLTADSLNAFTEWFFAGFTMSLARRQTKKRGVRSITCVLFLEDAEKPILQSLVGTKNTDRRGVWW